MLFCSQQFLLFFAVVFTAYWALPWQRARVALLLAASFYFYASWSHRLALLVCGSTAVDYLLARGIEASTSPRRRKLLLLASLTGNLGLLGYFKYANFFLHSLEATLRAAGAEASLPVLRVALPIGISFYTFEAINYMVDVYRRRIPAERNLLHFMLFILFFPHLVAGPIVRARDFLPQVRRPMRWDWVRAHAGVRLFLWGLFKKVAVADRLALFVDPVFADPGPCSSRSVWLAVVAYAFQVYCDFSGYTDMALGAAHLLGYRLAPNFDRPYLAPNIADLWRRWHMSLSGWFRDYLFVPLGGSRGGRLATARNLVLTMVLCGLWHGASWMFVAFGFLQGVWMTGHREFRAWCRQRPRLDGILQSPAGTALRVAGTFVGWCVCLVVFRSVDFRIARNMLHRLAVPHAGYEPRLFAATACLVALMALGHVLGRRPAWERWALRVPAPLVGAAYSAVLTATLLLAPEGQRAFIYFQF